ncbi:MAG: Thiol:disulfide interchange protein DsbD precursor [Candidatus Omnitrophica bacterium ADurb.Bin205]|nr:MAG: Thiol:disulfide interchange protein DsbD precursor [Candidatus Omnitrophica bacterium ADurb.Bin205]
MNLSGNPLDYILAFLGGVTVSFTPCVYPLVPVILGYIGVEGKPKSRGFILSLVYVSGIALTYSILGVAASLTGRLFGSISTHPITNIVVGLVIAIFGFSMLGLFFTPGNVSLGIRPVPIKSNKFISVFFLGITSGFIISPCLTPVLASILSYLATRKNILYGASLLAVFAYGMGLILILSGAFAGLLSNVLRPGKWMVYFQRAAGLILVSMGTYFIYKGVIRIE